MFILFAFIASACIVTYFSGWIGAFVSVIVFLGLFFGDPVKPSKGILQEIISIFWNKKTGDSGDEK